MTGNSGARATATTVGRERRLVSLRAKLRPVLVASYVTSAARMYRRGVLGHRRFAGDAATVCRSVVDAAWTGRYLAASSGHFRQFWTRDLAFSSVALVRLGERERLRASLAWAMRIWARGGTVTTTIFPGGRPCDVHTIGIDSLPLLLHALRAAEAEDLVARHAAWLGPAIRDYAATVVDPATSLVRDDRAFATHRDVVVTRSNATANTMLAVLSAVLRETGWFPDPIPRGAGERLVDRFWQGDRFVDDPSTGLVAGDANVFPFWFGVVPDDLGLASALRAIEAEGLADPLPLRYVARRDRRAEDPHASWLLPDYQGTAIWSSLGAMAVGLARRATTATAARWLAAWVRSIEAEGTVWEVLDGGSTTDPPRPYRGTLGLFRSDEAMLWAALFADLLATPR